MTRLLKEKTKPADFDKTETTLATPLVVIKRSLFSIWISSVLHPKETFGSEKSNASWKFSLLNYSIYPIALMLLLAWVGAQVFPLDAAAFLGSQNSGLMLIFGIILIVSSWIGALFWATITHFFARLLHGNGTLLQQYYVNSLYAPVVGIIGAILNASLLFSPWLFVLFVPYLLYSLYLMTIAFKEVHEFSVGKAVLSWISPILVLGAIAIIIALIAR